MKEKKVERVIDESIDILDIEDKPIEPYWSRELPKGMKKYEPLLKIIFNTEYIRGLSDTDWEGCVGCACVMAIMEGVRPSLFDLGKHLDIPFTNKEIELPFERLRINGVLGPKYNLKGDRALKGEEGISRGNKWRDDSEISMGAWCNMAGIASGLAGLREISLGRY